MDKETRLPDKTAYAGPKWLRADKLKKEPEFGKYLNSRVQSPMRASADCQKFGEIRGVDNVHIMV